MKLSVLGGTRSYTLYTDRKIRKWKYSCNKVSVSNFKRKQIRQIIIFIKINKNKTKRL